VFVLSPDALKPGSVAQKEVEFATSLNKRFAPIVYRWVDEKEIPEALRKLNFIFFTDLDHFEQSADQLAQALSTDIGARPRYSARCARDRRRGDRIGRAISHKIEFVSGAASAVLRRRERRQPEQFQ
jgi:hypothetical protein